MYIYIYSYFHVYAFIYYESCDIPILLLFCCQQLSPLGIWCLRTSEIGRFGTAQVFRVLAALIFLGNVVGNDRAGEAARHLKLFDCLLF